MPAVSVRGGILTRYAQIVIRQKARQLCRRSGFSRSDEEDLAQELTLRLLQKEHLYDPARGATLETFADRVISSAVKMILRDRRRLKRAASITALSLDSTAVLDDGKPALLCQIVSDADRARITLSERHTDDSADILALLNSLPAPLADLARRLTQGSVASAARELRVSRHQVYALIAQLRQHCEQAGLDPEKSQQRPAARARTA